MKSLQDWQKLISDSANQKFPTNSNRSELYFIDSIKKNLLDVEKSIKAEKGIKSSLWSKFLSLFTKRDKHVEEERDPNYRIAALLAPIFILSQKRGANIEKELEEVLKWFRQKIFIFHGTEGYPKENWFPWLKKNIEKKVNAKESTVFVPQFPSPPIVPSKISEWFDVFKKYEQYINEETIFICHSLSGKFVLRVLEKLEQPVKAVFFAGTPIGVPPITNNERDNAFTDNNFDWGTIKKKAEHFIVFQSDNDPYVGLNNGKELAKNLGVELSFIPNAGHFNSTAGYTEFRELWYKLEPLLAK